MEHARSHLRPQVPFGTSGRRTSPNAHGLVMSLAKPRPRVSRTWSSGGSADVMRSVGPPGIAAPIGPLMRPVGRTGRDRRPVVELLTLPVGAEARPRPSPTPARRGPRHRAPPNRRRILTGPCHRAPYHQGDDPPDRERPRAAARRPRRLPHEGRPGPGAVRGQGAEPQEPRPPVLAGRAARPRPRRCASSRPSTGWPTWSGRSPTPSARRCCWRRTWSSVTSRASTSGSRTTRATRSSRSPWPTTSRASSGPASCPRTAAATSVRTPRRRSVDEAMNLIRRLFPFRTCTIDIQEGERALARPCLLYHIKRCQGPCIEAIDKAAYRADIDQVMLFLDGRQEQVAQGRSSGRWLAASDAMQYERAAALRDKVARHRADDGGAEDGRLRASRAGRAGLRPVRQRGRGPAVRHPRRQDHQPRRVPAREPGRRARRGGAVGVRAPVLRDSRLGAAPRAGAPGRCRTRTSWRRSCGSAAAASWP